MKNIVVALLFIFTFQIVSYGGSWIQTGNSLKYEYVDGMNYKNQWANINNERYYFDSAGELAFGIIKINDELYIFDYKGQALNDDSINVNDEEYDIEILGEGKKKYSIISNVGDNFDIELFNNDYRNMYLNDRINAISKIIRDDANMKESQRAIAAVLESMNSTETFIQESKVYKNIIAEEVADTSTITCYDGAWEKDNFGYKYKQNKGGYLKNRWAWIDSNNDGKLEAYYFGSNYYMLANTTTPDGYQVNGNGVWVKNGIEQTKDDMNTGFVSNTGNNRIISNGGANNPKVVKKKKSKSKITEAMDKLKNKMNKNENEETKTIIREVTNNETDIKLSNDDLKVQELYNEANKLKNKDYTNYKDTNGWDDKKYKEATKYLNNITESYKRNGNTFSYKTDLLLNIKQVKLMVASCGDILFDDSKHLSSILENIINESSDAIKSEKKISNDTIVLIPKISLILSKNNRDLTETIIKLQKEDLERMKEILKEIDEIENKKQS